MDASTNAPDTTVRSKAGLDKAPRRRFLDLSASPASNLDLFVGEAELLDVLGEQNVPLLAVMAGCDPQLGDLRQLPLQTTLLALGGCRRRPCDIQFAPNPIDLGLDRFVWMVQGLRHRRRV